MDFCILNIVKKQLLDKIFYLNTLYNMLPIIRKSNIAPAKKGRSKHHTSDNSSATALRRKIHTRVASNTRKNTLFGDKYRITEKESIYLSAAENAAVAKPPTAAEVTAAKAAVAGAAVTVAGGNYRGETKEDILAADRNAKSGNAKKNLKRGQKPKGGDQSSYLYFKRIFPSMSLNSVTKQ